MKFTYNIFTITCKNCVPFSPKSALRRCLLPVQQKCTHHLHELQGKRKKGGGAVRMTRVALMMHCSHVPMFKGSLQIKPCFDEWPDGLHTVFNGSLQP